MKLASYFYIISFVFYLTSIFIFILRIINFTLFEYYLGLIQVSLLLIIAIMFFNHNLNNYDVLFYIQIIVFVIWLVFEFILDYILKIDFRNKPVLLIPYVILFFAACGSVIGFLSRINKKSAIIGVILFFITFILAFFQHFVSKKY